MPGLYGSKEDGLFFLNVDLDLETEADPTPLIRALEPHAFSLERPPGRASFELVLPTGAMDPDPLIRQFVPLIRGLPPAAREVWDRATRRVFDIGFQSRREPASATHLLTAAALREVVEIGAEIAVTVYALTAEDEV